MITYLVGMVKEQDDRSITIMSDHIGYGVMVSDPHQFFLDQKTALFIRLVWHQEEGPHLYGFITKQERTVFDLIISCSGFGPKLAMTMLAALEPSVLMRAIVENDIAMLSSISSVGKKKAESIIVQLKDKAAKLMNEGFAVSDKKSLSVLKDVSAALGSLGYSQKEITAATSFARDQFPATIVFDECLKKALSYLVKKI